MTEKAANVMVQHFAAFHLFRELGSQRSCLITHCADYLAINIHRPIMGGICLYNKEIGNLLIPDSCLTAFIF